MKIRQALEAINSNIKISKSLNRISDTAKGIMIGLYLTDQISYKQHEYINDCIEKNELVEYSIEE